MQTATAAAAPYAHHMLEFRVDQHRVTCTDDPLGERVWRCDCRDYGRRLKVHGEGFCAHLVVVFMELLDRDSGGPRPGSSRH